jgi:MerR family copper efflux transcriptional regulator
LTKGQGQTNGQEAAAVTAVTIGQAAEQTGLTPKAIRLYERKQLLPETGRTEAGYRLFDEHDLAVLRFIRQAKAVCLHLGEIKDILDLQREGQQPCGHVVELLDARIAEVDRTLADLRKLRRTLAGVRRVAAHARRSGSDAVVCRIIEHDHDTKRTSA